MAYTAPYIDDAGLHIPTYADIRDDLIDQFKTIYGDDLYLDNDSQDYQMISAFALKTYDTMQLLQIVYNNHSPKTAVGTGLDSLVKLNGIARKAASYSTCEVTLTGDAGTLIATGVVSDDANYQWSLPTNIKLTGEPVEVTAQCQTLGAIEAAPGTINKIVNPQKGWLTVTNKEAAIVGQPIETDEELRLRQSISVAIPSQNMLNGTIAGIASVAGVTRYKVYDNDTSVTDSNGIPSHSIAAVVEGGLDSEIAEQIYLRKGPGGGTYGTTSVEYTTSDKRTTIIRFFRPTYISVDAEIKINPKKDYTSNNLEGVKENVENFISSLDIGVDVQMISLLKAITSTIEDMSNPPFSLSSAKLGKSGNTLSVGDITIPFNAVAKLGTVKVEVVT